MITEGVTDTLLIVLRKILQCPQFENFALGGGTSLALRYGHRKSVDIDLFSAKSFNSEALLETIKNSFRDVDIHNRTKGSLCVSMSGVKLDILQHSFPMLAPVEFLEDIKCVSLKDLAAMKVNAVTNRGSKKDFIDLLLLHQNVIPLADAVELFSKKYSKASRFLAKKSLLFFEDAENEPDPVFLNNWTWQYVKKEMTILSENLIKIN